MDPIPLFGERSPTLVAAVFGDPGTAARAAEDLREHLHLGDAVSVLRPGDPAITPKLEPEVRGIWRTLVRTHLVLGAMGSVLGLAVGTLMILSWTAAAASPGFTLGVGVLGGLFAGLLLAGLLTLRPDHGRVITRVRKALRHGQFAVVAHPSSEAGARNAADVLRHFGGAVVRSF